MHTSGLVLTFAADPALSAATCHDLAAGPFTLGMAHGPCQRAVLETDGPGAAHDWHDWAAAWPGVESVEVVFVTGARPRKWRSARPRVRRPAASSSSRPAG